MNDFKNEIQEGKGCLYYKGKKYIEEPSNEYDNLPKRWQEIAERFINQSGYYININGEVKPCRISFNSENVFFNKYTARAFFLLKKLIEYRREYNGKWTINWNDIEQNKYSIVLRNNELFVTACKTKTSSMLIFKSEKLANKFLDNFKNDIEFVFNALYS